MKRQNNPETLLGERTTNYSYPVAVRSKGQIDRGEKAQWALAKEGAIGVESSIADPKLLSDKVRQIFLDIIYVMTVRTVRGMGGTCWVC